MRNIFEIANWFLSKEEMTHKKLQKLCYYAQCWHYATKGTALFNGDFEAWAHGPVNRELWNKLKDYKWNYIPQDELRDYATELDDDTEYFLGVVWNTYGEFDGSQIESITHQETPWQNARGNLDEYQRCTNKISIDDMKVYYSSLLVGDGVGE